MDPVSNQRFTAEHNAAAAKSSPSAGNDSDALMEALDSAVLSGGKEPRRLSSSETEIHAASDAKKSVNGARELFRDRSGYGTLHHLWDFDASGNICHQLAPASNGVLYCGTENGQFMAVKDGKKLWEIKLGDSRLSMPTLAPDGTVYVAGTHSVYAVKDGVKTAECEINEGEESISRPAVAADGTVYVTTTPGKLYAIHDGQKKWSYRPRSFFNKKENSTWSPPTVGPDGTVYAGTAAGKILAMADGKELWCVKMDKIAMETMTGDDYFNVHDNPFGAPILGPDGVVIVGTTNGAVYTVKEGKKIWSSRITNSMTDFKVGPDGTIYTLGSCFLGMKFDHSLCAINDGKITWSYSPEGEPYGLSICGAAPDGKVLLGSRKHIYGVLNGAKTGDLYHDKEGRAQDGCLHKPVAGPDGNFYMNHDGHTISAYTLQRPPESPETDGPSSPAVEAQGISTHEDWLMIDNLRMPIEKRRKI